MKKQRGLSQIFLDDLATGLLAPIAKRVRDDRTLCLEIRDDYINIYYRGGNLLRLEAAAGGYRATFDQNYFAGNSNAVKSRPEIINFDKDVVSWLDYFPLLKNAIDLFPKHSVEREVQQLLVADNNSWGAARASDYYICDIEYANHFGRFDFTAVHWPSSTSTRKCASDRRLVLGEVKYGDGALEGAAGLHSHVQDVNDFLGDANRVTALKKDMVKVFNQKLKLGLIECGKELDSFSEQTPMLLLVLANHDPDKSALRRLLASLPPSPNAEIRVASASLMGYGLFDPALLTVPELLEHLGGGA